MNSNRHQLTPEADSSQDGSPSSMQPHTAKLSKLHLKDHSPPLTSNECRKPPVSLKRPAAEEPISTKHPKRLESSSEDLYLHHGNRCSSPEGDCLPHPKHQSYDSWPGSMPRDSCRGTRSGREAREQKPVVMSTDRHDSLMENNVRSSTFHAKHAELTN